MDRLILIQMAPPILPAVLKKSKQQELLDFKQLSIGDEILK